MSNDNQQRPNKMYLGNGKEKTRQSGDKFLACSVCLDDIEKVPAEHIEHGTNGKRYLRIVINPYKDGANQYGNTHSIAVDTFKPNNQQNNNNVAPENTMEMRDVFPDAE